METVDRILHSAAQLVTCASGGKPKRGEQMRDAGVIPDGAVAIRDDKIIAAGTTQQILSAYSAKQTISAEGKTICPGLVDPHTHLVYAGDRINEFESRISGKTYLEIMAEGGGIAATMQAVRGASLQQLVNESKVRLDEMLRLGTTTAEVKTGYGLDTANEIKLLKAIELLDQNHPITLVPTFLGAHAFPPEYRRNEDAYTALIIHEMLPQALPWYRQSHFAEQRIPFFFDVFCEKNAFTLQQTSDLLKAAKSAGLGLKAHVDEFTELGALKLAVELGAVSVDHLDVSGQEGINTLAKSGTIGVVIPTVNFNLGSTHFANARSMIDSGAAIALTTDINPGSAPCPSMPLAMAIACRYQRLLPAEAFTAATINAAFAIGMGDRVGSIEPGKQADLLILNTSDYRHMAYQFGSNLIHLILKNGAIIQS